MADAGTPPPSPADPGEPGTARPILAETIARMPNSGGVPPVAIRGLARIVEFIVIGIVGALTAYFYIPNFADVAFGYIVMVPTLAFAVVLAFQALGYYRLGVLREPLRHGLPIASAFAAVFVFALSTVFFLKLGEAFSRGVFALWLVIGLAALAVVRLLFALLLRRLTQRGMLERRAVIVGGGEHAATLIEAMAGHAETGITICGVFDEREDGRSPDLVAGYPKLGTIDDLVAFARKTRVDLIIFTLPVTAEARILSMLRKLWVLPADIRLAAHMQKLKFRPRNYSYIGTLPMFDVADKPISDWDLIVKAAFDRVVGALLLVLLSPVMLLTALAIKLDSRGPVLFRQKRYGFNNELIEVFKFRSMHADRLDPSASKLVTRDDPRVTRVGRFIRRTSIDELPQLYNVVFGGSLSLVGPRPHALHAKADDRLYDEVVDGYFARHKVKPGITGWAQVNGWRGETDTMEKIQKRVEHDLHYIENWSVAFDLYILALTPFALIGQKNAY